MLSKNFRAKWFTSQELAKKIADSITKAASLPSQSAFEPMEKRFSSRFFVTG
jgi:hypothetical protein